MFQVLSVPSGRSLVRAFGSALALMVVVGCGDPDVGKIDMAAAKAKAADTDKAAIDSAKTKKQQAIAKKAVIGRGGPN